MKKINWKTAVAAAILFFLLSRLLPDGTQVVISESAAPTENFFLQLLRAASPIFLGFALAYLLNILMVFYRRILFPKTEKGWLKKTVRVSSIVLAFLTLFAILGAITGLILPHLMDCISLLMQQVPSAFRWLLRMMEKNELLSEYVLPYLKNIDMQSLLKEMVSVAEKGVTGVVTVVTDAVSGTVTVFLAMIFAGFLLAGKETLLAQVRRMASVYLPHKTYASLHYVFNVINHSFRRYIIGQCTEAVILGVLCALGMLILQLPYAPMISTLIAFTALIPVAGAYIGAAVGAVMILPVSPLQALVFLLFILILQQLEGNLIYPKVVGSSIGLPGFWVLVAVTVGGGLFGVWGMLLGVPLFAAAYRILRSDLRRRETVKNERKSGEEAEKPSEK